MIRLIYSKQKRGKWQFRPVGLVMHPLFCNTIGLLFTERLERWLISSVV